MTIDMSFACWFVFNEGEMTLSGENSWHYIPHKSMRIHGIAHLHIRHFFVEKMYAQTKGQRKLLHSMVTPVVQSIGETVRHRLVLAITPNPVSIPQIKMAGLPSTDK